MKPARNLFEAQLLLGEPDEEEAFFQPHGTPDPTKAKPGSDEKIDVLAGRLMAGLPLWHPDDPVIETEALPMERNSVYPSPETLDSQWRKPLPGDKDHQ